MWPHFAYMFCTSMYGGAAEAGKPVSRFSGERAAGRLQLYSARKMGYLPPCPSVVSLTASLGALLYLMCATGPSCMAA